MNTTARPKGGSIARARARDSALINKSIVFNRPFLASRAVAYMQQAIRQGHIAGDGAFGRRCEDWLEARLGVSRALLTTSGTHALEMAALLLDIAPGDEIIIPSFTFPSTANAFVLRGARPIFADIRPDTLNLDETKLDRYLTRRTRAIVVVHYAGIGCAMEPILGIAQKRGLPVIEDNAHGLLGKYRGKWLGTLGPLAALSFHGTKNFSCGEGGALLVNDPRYIHRAEILREKGTDRSRYFRGLVDKYSWVGAGSSYVLSDMLAAYLWAQFKAAQKIQSGRRRIWEHYYRRLAVLSDKIRLPVVPSDREQAYHLFYLILSTPENRRHLEIFLKERHIMSAFHYFPLHLAAMGRQLGAKPGDCPVAEDVSERLLRLPFHNDLTFRDQERVIESIEEFVKANFKGS